MSQDIENLIPTSNIVKQNDCVRVINKRKNAEFTETNIECIRVFNSINNQVQYQNNNIRQAVCLTIEDIKRSSQEQSCWKFHNISYRNVLIYGKIVIQNETSRDNRSFYTLIIDDETESIDGYLNKYNPKTQDQSDMRINAIAKGKSTLERRKETGIKLNGQYYPSESEECQSVISNLKKLQIMVEKNLKSSERKFQLGALKQKALVYGTPIMRYDSIRLNIFDISLDDELDLVWKQNINRLYSEMYFK